MSGNEKAVKKDGKRRLTRRQRMAADMLRDDEFLEKKKIKLSCPLY